MNRKRVLIIAYNYMPVVMAASFRVAAWAKYLPRFAWEPTILTRHWHDSSARQWEENNDETKLETDAVTGCDLIRTPYKQACGGIWNLRARLANAGSSSTAIVMCRRLLSYVLRNFLLFPDEYVGWHPIAMKAAAEMLKNKKTDAILATGAPWTSFVIAEKLSRQFDIPWVADYRDPWTQPTTLGVKAEYALFLHFNRPTEKRIMKSASALIHISEPLQQGLSAYLGREVHLIPNGYDPEQAVRLQACVPSGDVFTLSFVGTMHTGTNPMVFLDGFRGFVEQRGIQPAECRLSFTGSGFQKIELACEQSALIKGFTSCEGVVSHDEAAKRMREAHVLLSFPLDMDGCVPAKTYEYLATGRPILISPDGCYRDAIRKVITNAGAGVILNSADEIAKWIGARYDEFRKTGKVHSTTNMSAVEQYSRERETEKLAGILNRSLECRNR